MVKIDKRAWIAFAIVMVAVIALLATCIPTQVRDEATASPLNTVFAVDEEGRVLQPAPKGPIDFRIRGDRVSARRAQQAGLRAGGGPCWGAEKGWALVSDPPTGPTITAYGFRYYVMWCANDTQTKIRAQWDGTCNRTGGFMSLTSCKTSMGDEGLSRRRFNVVWNFEAGLGPAHFTRQPHVEAFVYPNAILEGTVWFQ